MIRNGTEYSPGGGFEAWRSRSPREWAAERSGRERPSPADRDRVNARRREAFAAQREMDEVVFQPSEGSAHVSAA